jgi:predicted MPP superfamily phosphohydrolase
MGSRKKKASTARRTVEWGAAAGAAAAAYMTFEAQWVHCAQADLAVPGLPSPLSGITVLHLSDVHAGTFPTNERSLRKVVDWALPLEPQLVLLTGDILGEPRHSGPCLEILSRLRPPLGMFAATGNHEYGIAKGPLVRARNTDHLWKNAGITLLRDHCVLLPERSGATMALCGADYLTGGFNLAETAARLGGGGAFPVLLIHEPPPTDSPLAKGFPLAFAGHTHGGQIRIPTREGLRPVNGEDGVHLGGVYHWGNGVLVVSRGIGASFVPLRLLTRPEATLWRLV